MEDMGTVGKFWSSPPPPKQRDRESLTTSYPSENLKSSTSKKLIFSDHSSEIILQVFITDVPAYLYACWKKQPLFLKHVQGKQVLNALKATINDEKCEKI